MENVRRLIGKANHALTRLKIRVETRLGIMDDVVIRPFVSWGTSNTLHVHGRVIEAKGLSSGEGSVLSSIADTLRRVESDEIGGAVLEVESEESTIEVVADQEGYFRVDIHSDRPFAPGWHHANIDLIDSIARGKEASARAAVLVPDPVAQYVVISDVDDTVIVTGATDTLRMWRIVSTNHAQERDLFPGVGALYRAFRAGTAGHPENAIFYITRSGWNLDDLFQSIFEERNIPKGPLLMSDFSNVEPPSETFGDKQTKLDWFEILFDELEQPFVLIGDSGQHDPENYLECVKRWPGRVTAVFIRDVTEKRRDRGVESIADEIRAAGVPVIVSDSSLEFARNAHRLGLIEREGVAAVEREVSGSEEFRSESDR